MGKATGKETVKNMEHLVKLLHKEWERSGRTKAEVSIDITDKKEVGVKLAAEIQERQKQLETAGKEFNGRREVLMKYFGIVGLCGGLRMEGGMDGWLVERSCFSGGVV